MMTNIIRVWKEHPNIFEINTLVWLNDLSNKFNEEINLQNIPQEIFDNYLSYFDAVWLMGIWERSPTSEQVAKQHEGLQKEFHNALDDFTEEDIIGSPYAVYYYHVDKYFGGKDGLQAFRDQLIELNVNLILDFVPNHVSRDHLWTLETSNTFIGGTREDLNNNPDAYFETYDKIFAHGKDPYFPSWTDTVQINAFSEDAREKAINRLLSIAEQCDAVRCDMAMLMTNEIFKKTWCDKVGSPPEREFWEVVISAVKQEFPEFKFIGEVYWNMQWDLMQQGFDYCYDKRLYDRIIDLNPSSIKTHLAADFSYQKRLVRFLENHDEPRIINELAIIPSLTGAILVLSLPGMGLIHEGQMKGYQIRTPVQLKRRKKEAINSELLETYRDILDLISTNNIKEGEWELCTVIPIDEEHSAENIISYHWWKDNGKHFLLALNFSEEKSKARIKIPVLPTDPEELLFEDKLNKNSYRYPTQDIQDMGLYIELFGWKSHIFEMRGL